jgi:hypothetical protein
VPAFETSGAFAELLDQVRRLEAKLFEGPNTPLDAQGVLEGYKWIFSILQVGFDAYVWADPYRPRFVDIVGPYRKWGGDNADAFYQYAPIDPARTYRVVANKGDAVYWSLTVYGGPADGRYSERIVGMVNDRDHAGGRSDATTYEIILSPEPQSHEGPWIKLEPDAVCAITRDYLNDPRRGRRMTWQIECLEGPHDPDGAGSKREDDSDLARRFRAVTTWIAEQAAIVPIPLGEPNSIDEPYPVPQVTFGWAAGDAAYAMGSFDLGEDEALVIEGVSPDCAFWNLCLWNQFLHTYNYDYERVTINGSEVAYNADGSWTLVVAHRDPGHPNWLSTAGHPRGRLWFRWFHPASTPDRPATKVVPIDQVGD